MYWYSEFDDDEEELPEDIDDEKYIGIPHKTELDLGKRVQNLFGAGPYEQLRRSHKGCGLRNTLEMDRRGVKTFGPIVLPLVESRMSRG